MATLDIRVMSELTVDEILFYKSSEANALSCIKKYPNRDCKSVVFKNCKGDSVCFLDMVEIDNLILALQRAKELWGNK